MSNATSHSRCILRQNKRKHSILMTSICPESRHCFQMVRLYTKCSIKTSIVNLQLMLSAIYANYTRSGVESPFRNDAWSLGRLTSSGWKFSAQIADASLGRLRSTQHEVAVFTAYVLLITTKLASLWNFPSFRIMRTKEAFLPAKMSLLHIQAMQFRCLYQACPW